MTPELIKVICRSIIRGVEEYEQNLRKDHVDSSGALADILGGRDGDRASRASVEPSKKVSVPDMDLDDLLQKIN